MVFSTSKIATYCPSYETMIKHQFPRTAVGIIVANAYCLNCGLSWSEISEHMMEYEGIKNPLPFAQDDCELRRRKNSMKAFW